MTEPRVRRSREATRKETRRRLLDAAFHAFVRRGYEATSVEEIAEAAGYSRGAIYSNFRDKDELYVTVLEERMGQKLEEIRLAAGSATDPVERMRALRESFVNEREDATAILYAELQLAAARHAELRRRLRAMFERQLAGCVTIVLGMPLPPETARVVFVTIFAVIEGLALQRASGNVSLEGARAARAIVFDAVCPILAAHLAETASAGG
jgi:AcrR family transcriptional regulator